MTRYRYAILEDQGVCPEGHPCRLVEDADPAAADDPLARVLRTCDTAHFIGNLSKIPHHYTGAALVDRIDVERMSAALQDTEAVLRRGSVEVMLDSLTVPE